MGRTPSTTSTPTSPTVHPHGRGEDARECGEIDLGCGSPPRAWGGRRPPRLRAHAARFTPTGVGRTVFPWGEEEVGRRFTPTGVGRTAPPPSRSGPSPVHPHGRGEDLPTAFAISQGTGSPPRAWGGRQGFNVPCRYHTVHPHGRGEDPTTTTACPFGSGSPPRAWGGPYVRHELRVSCRFTPTGVGRTPYLLVLPLLLHSVHPHGRGEDKSNLRDRSVRCGSPPRAWGGRSGQSPKARLHGSPPRAWGGLFVSAPEDPLSRFTPTGVGRTFWPGRRVRVSAGSPPRAWGGLVRLHEPAPVRRFTPTGVGRTSPPSRGGAPRPVHPHGRGEDASSFPRVSRSSGSPPRGAGRTGRFPRVV